MVAKLRTRSRLDDADVAAIHALPCTVRTLAAHSYLSREGARPARCVFVVSGFAFRHKLTVEGARQIVGFMVPGDFTDLQQLFLTECDHNIEALTRMDAAEIAIDDLATLAVGRPGIARALWIDALIEGSITRENLLNVGRRDGPTRLAHLICEFETRLGAAGLADLGYDLPMTQEQLGDATGLTSVHVNRMLKQLEREGLLSRTRRMIHIDDWAGLQRRADFNPRYLHLDQATAAGGNSAVRVG